MVVFDLLLDYLVHADCSHLRARDYGLLLSSLVVDRQSRVFLADALHRPKKAWRKQKGYQRYLDLEHSSLGERLSLSLGRKPPLEAAEISAAARAATAACTEASEYIWEFSPMPQRAAAFLHGDYEIVIRWMTTWAALQSVLRDGSGEHFVKFVRKELGKAHGAMQAKAFHTGRRAHEDSKTEAVEVARGFAQGLIARAQRYEARFTSA